MIEIKNLSVSQTEFNIIDAKFPISINLYSNTDSVDELMIKVRLIAPLPANDQNLGSFSVQTRKGDLTFSIDCNVPAVDNIPLSDLKLSENYFIFVDFTIKNTTWFRSYTMCHFKYDGELEGQQEDSGSDIGSQEPVSEDSDNFEEDNDDEDVAEEEEEETSNEEEEEESIPVKSACLDLTKITFSIEKTFSNTILDSFPN